MDPSTPERGGQRCRMGQEFPLRKKNICQNEILNHNGAVTVQRQQIPGQSLQYEKAKLSKHDLICSPT